MCHVQLTLCNDSLLLLWYRFFEMLPTSVEDINTEVVVSLLDTDLSEKAGS